MRPVLLALTALLLLGFASSLFLGGSGGWTSTTTAPGLERFDIERRAFKQVSITVQSSTGQQAVHQLTLLGPTHRIFEPWTAVTADSDGITLVGLDRSVTRVPPECTTAIWDEGLAAWNFSPEEFAACSSLPDFSDGSSLPDRLRALFPERGALVDRAYSSAGVRR